MAETKTTRQPAGLTRGKALLIGILAVVLVGVIYLQYGRSDAADPDALGAGTYGLRAALRPSAAAASPAAVADEQADPNLQAVLAEFDQTRWKPPELAEVVAYDPFALPSAFPQPRRAVLDPTLAAEGDSSFAALNAKQLADAVEQMQRQLEELQQRGVHVIVNVNDQYVALIGDRTLHVGDEINGFVVTSIDPDGVRVERKAIE